MSLSEMQVVVYLGLRVHAIRGESPRHDAVSASYKRQVTLALIEFIKQGFTKELWGEEIYQFVKNEMDFGFGSSSLVFYDHVFTNLVATIAFISGIQHVSTQEKSPETSWSDAIFYLQCWLRVERVLERLLGKDYDDD
jgi:hypothetical protein